MEKDKRYWIKMNSTKFIQALILTALVGTFQSGCRPIMEPSRPLAPAPMSWRVAAANLEDVFEQIPESSIDAFRENIPDEERIRVNAANGEAGLKDNRAYVYGEPSPRATDQMLAHCGVNENDVLFDCGCGRGFFLMQALLSTPIRRAVGAELATSRVEVGRKALELMIRKDLLPRGKILELYDQDMTRTDLSDATLVYMDSVFYSDELLATMARNMSRAKGLRKVIMIMKGLPPNPWFELETTEKLKMSWSPKFGSEVLYYRRTAAPAG